MTELGTGAEGWDASDATILDLLDRQARFFFLLSYFIDNYYLFLATSTERWQTGGKGPNDGFYRRLGLDIFVRQARHHNVLHTLLSPAPWHVETAMAATATAGGTSWGSRYSFFSFLATLMIVYAYEEGPRLGINGGLRRDAFQPLGKFFFSFFKKKI